MFTRIGRAIAFPSRSGKGLLGPGGGGRLLRRGADGAGPPVVTDLGIDATIAAGNGANDKTIWRLTWFAGKLWLGWGDYNSPATSHALRYWDPADGQYKTATGGGAYDSDALYGWGYADGKLWALATDPVGAGTPDYATIAGTTATIVSHADLATEHLFGLYQHTDGAIFLAGSQNSGGAGGAGAAIWRSTDGGTTWTRVHFKSGATSGDRYYGVCHVNGAFWSVAVSEAAAKTSADGVAWTDAGFDLLGPFQGPQKFAGAIFYHPTEYNSTFLRRFDGTGVDAQVAPGGNTVWGHYAADGYLYALVPSALYRTSDGTTWALAASLPASTGRSVAVQDGTAYVGRTDGGVWKVEGLGTLGTILVDQNEVQLTDQDGYVLVAA